MTTKIQLRRDTANNWTSVNPILDIGEQGYEFDTNKMKIGNGTSPWNDLQYFELNLSIRGPFNNDEEAASNGVDLNKFYYD